MISLITLGLQIVLLLLQQLVKLAANYQKWSLDQKLLAEQRMRDTLASFKKLVSGAHDSLNEDAFLGSIADERAERYQIYRDMTASILSAGKGISELSTLMEYGYHDRILKCQPACVKILNLVLSPIEKAQFIARELVKW